MVNWKERAGKSLAGLREVARRGGAAVARIAARPSARRRAGATAITAVVLVLLWNGVVRIREGEVAVFVNNVTGTVRVEERAGYQVVFPWVVTPHRLDRRVQTLVMSDQGGQGFVGGDAVKVKTLDGSNVSLDVQVTYRLVPDRAGDILKMSGPGSGFGDLWVRSAVRSMAAREWGKLTTEQVYDAALRNERALATLEGLNRELAERGLEIVAVVPQEYRFYREYEEVIKRKKLADQEVEEQQAKARLAIEEQKKKVAEAEYAKAAKIATAKGEADRTKAEAEGYAQRVRLESEGALVTAQKRAEGFLATGLAEGEGLRQAGLALAGAGGVNLVALEYARQLAKISFTGVPTVHDGRMSQYRIQQVPGSVAAPAVSSAAGGAR